MRRSVDTEYIKLYIRLKWAMLLIMALYVASWAFIGPYPFFPALQIFFSFAALFLAALINILLDHSLRGNKDVFVFTCGALTADLFLIVLINYVSGGIENTWLFLPVIVVMAAGFLFGIVFAYAFAAVSSLLVAGMYLLEFYKSIPHFGAYGFPEPVWRNVNYGRDYIAGMFVLYFIGATMSGFFKRALEAAKRQLESKLGELEDSRRAILHLLQDVDQSREEANRKAEEIAKLYEKLKAVDRMKTEFISMISHELRTPMTPIKGYAEMLLSGEMGELPDPQKKAVGVIKKEGEHLLGLIDSILDVSRLERGVSMELKKEPVSIKVLLDDLREVMGSELENRGIKLEVDLSPDFPTLIADASKLHRLLTNLLGNAMKFTPRGGWIRVAGRREGDTARIEVIDNGVGVAKENLEKIFERFYQVDSSYTRAAGGAGLGLAVAREIVEAHGGKIWAESDGLGKGTRVIFTLPVL